TSFSQISNPNNAFGDFNFGLQNVDGFDHAFNSLSFTITKNTGTWTSLADVLTKNSDGYVVQVHVFVTDDPAIQSNGALATGFATTPEFGSATIMGVMLLGSGGIAGFRRMRRTAKA